MERHRTTVPVNGARGLFSPPGLRGVGAGAGAGAGGGR